MNIGDKKNSLKKCPYIKAPCIEDDCLAWQKDEQRNRYQNQWFCLKIDNIFKIYPDNDKNHPWEKRTF